jgi:hypothetical protein
MKILNKFLIGLSIIFLASCDAFVEKVDEFDPTNPRDASVDQMLVAAQVNYIGFNEGDLTRISGIWAGQFAGVDRQYTSYQVYNHSAGDFDATWATLYSGVIQQCRIIEKKSTELNNKTMLGIAQVVEAHAVGTATSLWGDIPFTQAANIVEFSNPAYEGQAQVYASVQTLLDNAITNLNANLGTAPTDVFFGGSRAAWIAVANTVKAKFYLHVGNYQKALEHARLGISSDAGNVRASHGTTYGVDFNVFYSFLVYDRPGYMSADGCFAPNILDPASGFAKNRNNAKTVEGARFDYLYQLNEIYAAGYEPNFLSVFDWGAPDGFFGTETDYDIISYRENQLILAEAELRVNGFDAGLAALNTYRAYLDAGGYINPDYIGGNILYEAYTSDDFANGGIENADGISASAALYREIVEERYVSLIGHFESYTDLRRKGIGEFANKQNWEVIGITPNTGSNIPQRFLYSQNEINSNTSTPNPIPGLFDKTEVFK